MTAEHAELVVLRWRPREFGAELAIHHRAAELLMGDFDTKGSSRPST